MNALQLIKRTAVPASRAGGRRVATKTRAKRISGEFVNVPCGSVSGTNSKALPSAPLRTRKADHTVRSVPRRAERGVVNQRRAFSTTRDLNGALNPRRTSAQA